MRKTKFHRDLVACTKKNEFDTEIQQTYINLWHRKEAPQINNRKQAGSAEELLFAHLKSITAKLAIIQLLGHCLATPQTGFYLR